LKLFSRKYIDFLLHEVSDLPHLLKEEYFSGHNAETTDMVLDTALEISKKEIEPYFTDSDRNEPAFEDGKVKVHPGVHGFVKSQAETGLLSATFPEETGGSQLPETVAGAASFIEFCYSNSFPMYTDLLIGCVKLISEFGTPEQKKTYVQKMLSAEWMGTMCLTEPQAGSSLSEISTRAIPQADGLYKIEGQKIFISAGDHDITENIVHLVLARIEGAPAGAKGISLFIVPKNKPENCAESNDVKTIGLFHKMGQKATPAVHLAFGAEGNCTGYLLGQPNQGLPQMFKMMNSSRLAVGLAGLALSSAAYYTSNQYAHERRQGRLPIGKENVVIAKHPDVKRMLLKQKAIHEGGLALFIQVYGYLDWQKAGKEVEKYAALTELLTPVCKFYGSEQGLHSVNEGLQVLGGYGYTCDFPLEQMARDVRILSIYEGTNGIQAQAILGRQVQVNGGASFKLLQGEIEKTLHLLSNSEAFLGDFEKSFEKLKVVTSTLLNKQNPKELLADATLYAEFFGLICVGWQWLKMSLFSEKMDSAFKTSFEETMGYFFRYEFPKCLYLNEILLKENKITV
jgi:butyryl-CoA dehydrogenase